VEPDPQYLSIQCEAFRILDFISLAANQKSQLENHQQNAVLAIDKLEQNPLLRNSLFNLPLNCSYVPSVHEVLSLFFGVLSPTPIQINKARSSFVLRNKATITRNERMCFVRSLTQFKSIATITNEFPALKIGLLHTRGKFLNYIIGDDALNGLSTVSIGEIRRRLSLAQLECETNLSVDTRSADLGKAWLKHIRGRAETIMKVQQGVAGFLRSLSQKGYLDELADEDHDFNSSDNGTFHGTVQDNLLLKDTSGNDSSSIAIWDYPLSPSFIDFVTTTGLEDLMFMEDPGHHNTGRLLRVESVDVRAKKDILFQVGSDKKGVAHKARPMSAIGREFINIANYLSRQVHGFIMTELKRLVGNDLAEEWAPRMKVYDLINHQVALKAGAEYDWHHDCKNMLCDDQKEGWKDFDLCVPTFVISNQGDGVSSIGFRHKEATTNDKGKQVQAVVGSRTLAAQSLHFQLFGSNSIFQHRPSIKKPPQNYIRWVVTCRETTKLQKSGFQRFQNCQTRKIPIVGNTGSYSTTLTWNTPNEITTGSEDEEENSDTEVPTDLDADVDAAKNKPKAKTRNSTRKGGRACGLIRPLDGTPAPSMPKRETLFALGTHVNRKNEGFDNWPKPPDQRTAISSDSLMDILCSSEAVEILNNAKCTVTCHVPNGDGTLRAIPQAPFWNHSTNRPYVPGDLFHGPKLAATLDLPCSSENNRMWHHKIERMNSYIAYQLYKQQLPTSQEDDGGLKKDVERVIAGQPMKGFWVTGSGGNPQMAGTYGPTADRATVQSEGSNGHFTTVASFQKIDKNANNFSMVQACLLGKRINIFASGDCLPPHIRTNQEHGYPQTMYLGPAIVDGIQIIQDKENDIEDVARSNPDVKGHYLQHRSMRHLRFHFVPDTTFPIYNKDEKWNEWTHLHVCSEKVLTLMQNVGDSSVNHDTLYDPLSGFPKPHVSTMLNNLFGCDRHEILKTLWIPSQSSSLAQRATTRVMNTASAGEAPKPISQDTSLNVCHTPAVIQEFDPKNNQSICLGSASRRTVSPEMFTAHLQNLMVGVAARAARMNLDSDCKIGPLIDPVPKNAKGNIDKTQNPNFIKVFGRQALRIKYMNLLSYLHARRAYPSALRTLDVKTWNYITSCILGGERVQTPDGKEWMRSNQEKVCDLFFQAVVTETSGRMTSNRQFRKEHPLPPGSDLCPTSLPILAEIDTYLDWMQRRCVSERNGKMTDMLHGQYAPEPKMQNFEDFSAFLKCLAHHIPSIVENCLLMSTEGNTDRRNAIISRICTVFVDKLEFAPGQNLRFMVSQILANMEEVIAGDPFGKVMDVPLGSGSRSGLGLIDFDSMYFRVWRRKNKGIEKMTTKEKLELILQWLGTLSKLDLALMGIDKKPEGLFVKCNGRRLTLIDAEHMVCKIYIIFEVMPGGGRAFSNAPMLSFAHCHPVKSYYCQRLHDAALSILRSFIVSVQKGQWITPLGETTQAPVGESECDGQGESVHAVQDNSRDEGAISKKRRRPIPLPTRNNRRRVALGDCHHDIEGDGGCIEEVLSKSKGILVGLCMIFSDCATAYTDVIRSTTHSPKEKRDTARCLRLEEILSERGNGGEMITIDYKGTGMGEDGIRGRTDRHISCDINYLGKRDSGSLVLETARGRIREVYLDFVWCNGAYYESNIRETFYRNSLLWLAELLCAGGSIFLPLIPSVLFGLLEAEQFLVSALQVTFLDETQSKDLCLVQATNSIPEKVFRELLEKEPQQERMLGCTRALFLQKIPNTQSNEFRRRAMQLFDDHQVQEKIFIKLTRYETHSVYHHFCDVPLVTTV
jgi:hypothetical protein